MLDIESSYTIFINYS